jgi:hypothetical protein
MKNGIDVLPATAQVIERPTYLNDIGRSQKSASI